MLQWKTLEMICWEIRRKTYFSLTHPQYVCECDASKTCWMLNGLFRKTKMKNTSHGIDCEWSYSLVFTCHFRREASGQFRMLECIWRDNFLYAAFSASALFAYRMNGTRASELSMIIIKLIVSLVPFIEVHGCTMVCLLAKCKSHIETKNASFGARYVSHSPNSTNTTRRRGTASYTFLA